MAASGETTLPTIGFLTVVEESDWGWTGGLLVLNTAGRPLEFHCTSPLKPNRAQEILYGPTLRPFLYGEQIGQTLISKAKCEPQFVCTDVEPALCVRDVSALPIVLVLPEESSSATTDDDQKQKTLPFSDPSDPNRLRLGKLSPFALGKQAVAVLPHHVSDRDVIIERWKSSANDLDLWEPFGRIREALEEARRGTAKG